MKDGYDDSGKKKMSMSETEDDLEKNLMNIDELMFEFFGINLDFTFEQVKFYQNYSNFSDLVDMRTSSEKERDEILSKYEEKLRKKTLSGHSSSQNYYLHIDNYSPSSNEKKKKNENIYQQYLDQHHSQENQDSHLEKFYSSYVKKTGLGEEFTVSKESMKEYESSVKIVKDPLEKHLINFYEEKEYPYLFL